MTTTQQARKSPETLLEALAWNLRDQKRILDRLPEHKPSDDGGESLLRELREVEEHLLDKIEPLIDKELVVRLMESNCLLEITREVLNGERLDASLVPYQLAEDVRWPKSGGNDAPPPSKFLNDIARNLKNARSATDRGSRDDRDYYLANADKAASRLRWLVDDADGTDFVVYCPAEACVIALSLDDDRGTALDVVSYLIPYANVYDLEWTREDS